MIVTSLFLFNLMCSFVPCDQNYGDPVVGDSSSKLPKRFRFSRSGTRPKSADLTANGDNSELLEPVVETKNGILEGYVMKIINGQSIYAFEGIPYAEAPIGHLRFRDPVPKESWAGVRQATSPGPICLQYHVRKLVPISGSEACLHISIYTPSLPLDLKGKFNNPKLPVIFWIHGGGFFFGSGSEYGPSYLLQEQLVLVAVNFRQGLLGFLSTGDSESPGNYGLKDTALALKWVSENIAAFGGDPNKITLMGHSSGASIAHLHMMSPLTSGLFHGVISMSGSAMNHWAVSTSARSLRLTRKLAENVGCPTTVGSKALVDCLRACNPHFLLHEQQKLYDFMTFPPILFGPVVELPGTEGAFLVDTPENMYAAKKVPPIPWISTQTTDEGLAFANGFKLAGRIPFYNSNFDRFAPHILDYWYIAKNPSEITAKLRDIYFGNAGPLPSEAAIQTLSELVSDRYFRVGIHRAITLHSHIAPTYASLFGFQSSPATHSFRAGSYGVGHANDIGFYFNSSLYFNPLTMSTPSYDVSRMLINLVANFAKQRQSITYREPLLTYRNGNTAKIWKLAAFQGRDLRFLLIDTENVIMIPEPRKHEIAFWESLGLEDTAVTGAAPGSTENNQPLTSTIQSAGSTSMTQLHSAVPSSYHAETNLSSADSHNNVAYYNKLYR